MGARRNFPDSVRRPLQQVSVRHLHHDGKVEALQGDWEPGSQFRGLGFEPPAIQRLRGAGQQQGCERNQCERIPVLQAFAN